MESRTLSKGAASAALATSLIAVGAGTATVEAQVADAAPSMERSLRDLFVDSPRRASSVAEALTGQGAAANERVQLPRRGTDRIEVRASHGSGSVDVGLPRGLRAQSTAQRRDQMASFEANSRSFEVTTESLDSGARALVTIRSGSAPTEYHFDIGSDVPVRLAAVPSGGVEVLGPDSEAIAYVEAPWAVDAAGSAVETSFRVEGNVLVQVVEHEGAAYPVVADPAIQHDCGWTTCTIRFDRGRTKWIADNGSWYAGLSSGACAGSGPIIGVCIAGVNAIGFAVVSHARSYYNNGNCYGIRYPKNFAATLIPIPPPHSTQVAHGTFNCTGK